MSMLLDIIVPASCIYLLLLLSAAGPREIAIAGVLLVLTALRAAWPGRRPSGRSRLCRELAWLAALAGVKTLWVVWMMPDGARLMADRDAADLLSRRAYLIEKTASPAFGPALMPAILPEVMRKEWAIVTLSMTSTALANIAFQFGDTRIEALRVIDLLIQRYLQPDLRSFEDHYWGEDALETLAGGNGHIGYLGHLNLMLGARRMLGGDSGYDVLHRDVSAALARRILLSPAGGYLETFPGMIFVPDNSVVLASLALHDRIFGPTHAAAIARWVEHTRSRLIDPETGLIATMVSPHGGARLGGARGSYACWNSIYLPFFEPELARSQYSQIRRHLLRTLPFGARAIREYPPGTNGRGDIDSGPVVFGLSTSGTGFCAAGARFSGDAETLGGLLLTAETVGTTVPWAGTRRYVFAPLVGDAIMLAVKTARIWDSRYLGAAGAAGAPLP